MPSWSVKPDPACRQHLQAGDELRAAPVSQAPAHAQDDFVTAQLSATPAEPSNAPAPRSLNERSPRPSATRCRAGNDVTVQAESPETETEANAEPSHFAERCNEWHAHDPHRGGIARHWTNRSRSSWR
jgi:hypothetical protein